MFLVSFTTFAYTKSFWNRDCAIEYMMNCGSETNLLDQKGKILCSYSPVTGYREP